jgi:YD repeat-containing protein
MKPKRHLLRVGLLAAVLAACWPTGTATAVVSHTYDSAGQQTTITDPLNHAVTLGYALGDLVSASDALGNTASRFLDAGGRVVRSTDPVGNVTSFNFNALNDLTKITDAKAGETSFAYDGNGNLSSLTDARNKVTSYTYDSMDRLATRVDPLSRSESYAYDLNGNLSRFTDRRGKVTSFQYVEFPRFCGHLSAWAVRPGKEDGVHVQDPVSTSLPRAVPA